MTKAGNVFNFIDGLLPDIDDVTITVPSELQFLYAGIGMPSLRILEVAQACQVVDYQGIKAANLVRRITAADEFRRYYTALRAAALMEDEDALNDLGWLWLNGRWLPADYSLARSAFKLAASLGSAEALFNLGAQSSYGKGAKIDLNLAIGFFELAYEQGIICAAEALGSLYESGGDDLAVDSELAVEWYLRGAQYGGGHGGMECLFSVGRLALDNTSENFDVSRGLYWLQYAAMNGHCMSAELLADFYHTGLEMPDPEQRLYAFWRDHAIRLGSSWAREMKMEDDTPQLYVVKRTSGVDD